MSKIKLFDWKPFDSTVTKIRDKDSSNVEVQCGVTDLGAFIGKQIESEYFTQDWDVITPMQQSWHGRLPNIPRVALLTTKPDIDSLGKGIQSSLDVIGFGYVDFGSLHGRQIVGNSASITWIKKPSDVSHLIIAKSVIATGCTAIELAKKWIMEFGMPEIIFTTLFYSHNGIKEISTEFRSANFLIPTQSDDLDGNGYLIPGVGNLDERQKVA